MKDESIKFEVFKGYDKNTVLTFKSQGNDAPGEKSSKNIFYLFKKVIYLYK